MKHTDKIKSLNIENKDLAEEIGDLYYDSLSEFLKELSLKLKMDSKADKGRGRVKLSKNLENASELILGASKEIDLAWDICKEPVRKFLEENK